jgi:hypothetical protein
MRWYSSPDVKAIIYRTPKLIHVLRWSMIHIAFNHLFCDALASVECGVIGFRHLRSFRIASRNSTNPVVDRHFIDFVFIERCFPTDVKH